MGKGKGMGMRMRVHTKHLAARAGAGAHKQHRPLMSKANKIFAMNGTGSGSGNHRRKSIGCVCRIHLLYLHN